MSNTYTPTQLKDALRILKHFRDSPNYSKAVRQAMAVAVDAVKKQAKENLNNDT